MIPVPLNGAEVRTLKNPTTGAEMHVIAARGMCFSSWRFSPEEHAKVQAGKPVWVIIRGEVIPEFILAVGDRREVVPPEIIRRAQQADAVINSELGVKVQARQRREHWIVEALAWGYLAGCVTIAGMGLALILRLAIGR